MNKEIQTMNRQKDSSSLTEDLYDGRYFCINKRFLQLIGQWPYQHNRARLARLQFIVIMSLTGLGPQIRAMIATWGRLDTFVASFTPIVANLGALGILFNSQCHKQQMRKILDQTTKNWNSMRHSSQVQILQDYAEKGRLYTIMYLSVCYSAMVGWILTPLVPKILDVVVPLNHSRKRLDMIPTDYAVDPDVFFWEIFFHLGVAILLVMSVIVTIDAFYMVLAQHACGMFSVLRNDVENALLEDDINNNVVLQPDYQSDEMYHYIVSCIKRHKSIVEYVNSIQSTCEWILLVAVGVSVVALSFTSYQTIAKSTPRVDVVRMGLFSVAQFFHLYGITLPSHWISEESACLPTSVYSVKWYMMSLRSRHLLVLFIRATLKPCVIVAGKVYVMSVENFCGVVQTAMSYLTMLTSLQ